MGYGVIGNTTVSGAVVLGSNPGIPAQGALAQLVAHLFCKQKVTGSRPVGSTE